MIKYALAGIFAALVIFGVSCAPTAADASPNNVDPALHYGKYVTDMNVVYHKLCIQGQQFVVVKDLDTKQISVVQPFSYGYYGAVPWECR